MTASAKVACVRPPRLAASGARLILASPLPVTAPATDFDRCVLSVPGHPRSVAGRASSQRSKWLRVVVSTRCDSVEGEASSRCCYAKLWPVSVPLWRAPIVSWYGEIRSSNSVSPDWPVCRAVTLPAVPMEGGIANVTRTAAERELQGHARLNNRW